MGRLVDIDDVKILINGLDSLPWEEEVDDLLKMLPTAYDVEKVVAELEEDLVDIGAKTGYCKGITKAIEIVKGGVENATN